MQRPDAERIRSYLELIAGAGKRGLEAVLETEMPRSGFEGTEAPAEAAARSGAEAVLRDRDPSEDQLAGMEALIIPKLRPAIDIVGGSFKVEHRLWTHLQTDAAIRGRIEAAIPSIGRIELPGHPSYPYGGTGFVVGDGLIMTNRHVAAIFARGLGSRGLGIRQGLRAGIDFLRERGGKAGPTLAVRRVVMIHPYWDMAILAVDGLPAEHAPLKLSLADLSDLDGREIAVVGYPAFDPRNDAAEQDKLFEATYGVKRLQPGQLHGRAETESFGKLVSASAHDCSTLGGNSGSAVIDLATGEVVALHFGGRYQERNYAVPTFELARDGRVVAAGLAFAGTPAGGSPRWSDWWTRADTAEATGAAPADDGDAAAAPTVTGTAAGDASIAVQAGGVTIEIPLRITVQLGAPAVVGREAPEPSEAAQTEGLVAPWVDQDYANRRGYDTGFLGTPIPMPEAADAAVVAPTLAGGAVLPYENFSIVMHARRRLALVTASNVSADPRLKRPDPGKAYSRRALSGLGEHDRERWLPDRRMDARFQLPDAFFTRDRGAFDKGHIVRRDDVAWGESYEQLRRANGDTYHVTNCSPQTAAFNRSTLGVENWGDLENHVLASAAQERLALFAGPVLAEDDPVFPGVGDGGVTLRARIPRRFWKVVVATTTDGPAAFGFVLEQDLADVDTEFAVGEEFVPHMRPLREIEAMTGLVFPGAVRDADQHDTVRGAEVAIRAGARRSRTRRAAA